MKSTKQYDIRLATMSDVKPIMTYIHEHWRHNHIMSRDIELFLYEFKEGDSINMILAIDDDSQEIVGIHGFMKTALQSQTFDVWGSFWHVRPDIKAPMLGAMLIKSLKKFVPYRNRLEIGINKKTTEKIYKSFFKDKVSKLGHYYQLNEKFIDNFKIAKINNIVSSSAKTKGENISYCDIINPEDIDYKYIDNDVEKIPYKNSTYIKKRYFSHPRFSYKAIKITSSDSMALIVTREVNHLERKVLRIIDYIGDFSLLKYCRSLFKDLLDKDQFEYIDVYNLGIDEDLWSQAGFIKRGSSDLNIIPNYFSPFIQENIDIYVSYKNENSSFFLGDGDQDRPNT